MVLSPEIQVFLAAGIAFLVTNALKVISTKLGFDLSGNSARITAALVAAAVLFANQLLALIPAQYQPIVGPAMALLAAVLGTFGVHATLNPP